MRNASFLWLVSLTVLFCSCDQIMGKKMRGNGNIKTEDRSVSAFKNLEVSSTCNVYITQADQTSVRVEGDENLLPYIEVLQNGDEVVIRNRNGYNLESSHGLSVHISAPAFQNISLSGAGDIESMNKLSGSENLDLELSGAGNIKMEVDVPKLKASVSGAGSIYIHGQTKDAELSVSGAGSAHCYDLMSESTRIDVSGVGSGEVYASVHLDAQVNGVGSVHYKGNPATVTQHVSGVGSISKE